MHLDKHSHQMYNIGILIGLLQKTVVKSSHIDGIYNPEKEF